MLLPRKGGFHNLDLAPPLVAAQGKSDTWNHGFKKYQRVKDLHQTLIKPRTMKVLSFFACLLVFSAAFGEETEGNRLAKVLPIFQVVT